MGFPNLFNSEKGRFRCLWQPETKRMRILKTAELQIKAIFIGWKLGTTTLSSFDIRTTVGPLEDYLRSLRNLPAFGVEGFEALEICRFFWEMPKRICFWCLQSLQKTEEAEKCTKRIQLSCWKKFLTSVIALQIGKSYRRGTSGDGIPACQTMEKPWPSGLRSGVKSGIKFIALRCDKGIILC